MDMACVFHTRSGMRACARARCSRSPARRWHARGRPRATLNSMPLHVSYSLNSFRGRFLGDYIADYTAVIKVGTRSLEYRLCDQVKSWAFIPPSMFSSMGFSISFSILVFI